MDKFPHHYTTTATGRPDGEVSLSSEGLTSIATAPPKAFGGPGDRWSPETLLVAAVADCFILTFRAIARASKFAWTDLRCEVEGVLDRQDGVTRFTEFVVVARLDMAEGSDEAMARRLLQKAEQGCLITQSLRATTSLQIEINP